MVRAAIHEAYEIGEKNHLQFVFESHNNNNNNNLLIIVVNMVTRSGN